MTLLTVQWTKVIFSKAEQWSDLAEFLLGLLLYHLLTRS